MSLPGYKPKHRPAPWKMAQELSGGILGGSMAQTLGQPSPAHGVKRYRRLPRVSKRRKKRGIWAQYPEFARGVVRKARADGRRCPVTLSIQSLRNGTKYGYPISSRIRHNHHVFGHGPNEELLMWDPGCFGVSVMGHRWIHSNIDEARNRGWYAPVGFWDNPRRVFELWELAGKPEKLYGEILIQAMIKMVNPRARKE